MSFVHSLFSYNKNQPKNPLQICWRAATIPNYIGIANNKVSNVEIDAIDLVDLCNQVRAFFDGEKKCHLYVLAQIMYGAMRIFNHQVISLSMKCDDFLKDANEKFSKRIEEKSGSVQATTEDFPSLDKFIVEEIPQANVENLFSPESPIDTNLMDETNVNQLSAMELDEPIHNDFENDDSFLPEITSSPPENLLIAVINQERFDGPNFPIRSQRHTFSCPTATLDLSSISERAQTAATPPKKPRLDTWQPESPASQTNVFFVDQYLDYEEMIPDADLPRIEATQLPDELVETSEVLPEISLHLPGWGAEPTLPAIHDDSTIEPFDALTKDHTHRGGKNKLFDGEEKLLYSNPQNLSPRVHTKKRDFVRIRPVSSEILHLPSTMSRTYGCLWARSILKKFWNELRMRIIPEPVQGQAVDCFGLTTAVPAVVDNHLIRSPRIILERIDNLSLAAKTDKDRLVTENEKTSIVESIDFESVQTQPVLTSNHFIRDIRIVLERIDNLNIETSNDKDRQVNRSEEAPIVESINFEPVQTQPVLTSNHFIRDIRIVLERIDNLNIETSNDKDRRVNRSEEAPIVESINFEPSQAQPMSIDEGPEIVHSECGSVRNRDENFYDESLPPAKRSKITSPRTSSAHQFEKVVENNEIILERMNFFRTIQKLWRNMSTHVSFETVVNPSNSTPEQAYDNFIHCLYLATDGKIKLYQKQAYSTIFLLRP